MGKMRNYAYGSPKFEKDINKAVTDGKTPEGTAVKSTGATNGKVLTANGTGGASWKTVSHTPEGTAVKSTGVTSGKVLTANGSGGSSWETASGGGRLYRHKVEISARDANYTTYYFGIILYSTNATPIFDSQQTTTITDVVNFITPLLNEYSQTPAYIVDGVEYHFEKLTDGIEGTSLTYNTAESGRSAITNITDAIDTVAEV